MKTITKLTPGTINLQKFEAWIKNRDAANDWADYIRGGKLNRTEVASECGFGMPAFQQNPAISQALVALEARLQVSGLTATVNASSTSDDAATVQAVA